MKLNNTPSVKSKSGMTLLELTVVILVLLSLISILFIGARAWKKGSDRSANILNIRNVQQAVRGHGNLNTIVQATADGGVAGGPVTRVMVFGAAEDGVGAYLKFPASVATVTYDTPSLINGPPGQLYLNASATGAAVAAGAAQTEYGPTPGSTVDW